MQADDSLWIVVVQPIGSPDSERRVLAGSQAGTMRQALATARATSIPGHWVTIIKASQQAGLFGEVAP